MCVRELGEINTQLDVLFSKSFFTPFYAHDVLNGRNNWLTLIAVVGRWP